MPEQRILITVRGDGRVDVVSNIKDVLLFYGLLAEARFQFDQQVRVRNDGIELATAPIPKVTNS